MELKATTILPADDMESASRMMKDLINDQAVVLGVVVGSDDWCKYLIKSVDSIALNHPENWRSVWIKNPEPVYEILQTLFGNSKGIHLPEQKPFFFTVSLSHKVCDLLLPGKPILNISRVVDAFISAEIG